MKLSVSTGLMYRRSAEEILDIIKASGAKYIEICLNQSFIDLKQEKLINMVLERDLKVTSIHLPFAFLMMERGETEEYWVNKCLNLANVLDAELLVTHAVFRSENGEKVSNSQTHKKVLEKINQQTKIYVTTENMPKIGFGFFSEDYDELKKYLQVSGVPLTYDITHAAHQGRCVEEDFLMFESHIKNIHLSDFGDGNEHKILGDGSLNLDSFLRLLDEKDYNGLLTIELDYENEKRNVINGYDAAVDGLKRSIDLVENILGEGLFKRLISPYKGLPKGVYVIFFATVLNNLGNFVGPVLTLLMSKTWGIPVSTVGYVIAVNGLVGLLGSIIGGKLIDQIGRKSIFVFFRTLAAIGLLSCTMFSSKWLLIGALMFSSFTSGIANPVFNTIMTDITTEENRKAAFSLRYLGINVGYAVGPIIATQLYRLEMMNTLFFGDALTVLGSILLILIFVEETKPDFSKGKSGEKTVSTMEALRSVPVLFKFSLISVLLFVVFSQFNFGMPLTVTAVLGNGGAGHFGVMLSINAVICSVFTVPITSITKNISPAKSIQYGALLYALGFGAYGIIKTPFAFYLFTGLWTVGEILIATNTSVFIANHSPETHRGRFNAIFPIIRRLGSFLGPILAGTIIESFNYAVLWSVIACISIVASLQMGRLQESYAEILIEK